MEKETGNIQVDFLVEEAQRELGILLSAKAVRGGEKRRSTIRFPLLPEDPAQERLPCRRYCFTSMKRSAAARCR